MATGFPFGAGLVARHGQTIVDAQGCARPNNVGFAELNQGRMNSEMSTFDPGFGGQIGHVFEGGDVLRPAVRVAGIVDGVDADEDIAAIERFGQGQRQREHDGVACRYVGRWNAGLAVGLGHVDAEVGECRTAKLVHVDMNDAV